MKNIINYIKDKSYYFLGGTIIIIVLLIIINSCSSSGNSYEAIEQNMVSAAKEYYANHKSNLPKEENGSVQVTINTLIEAELISEVVDPKNKEQTCTGYVQVKKVEDDYVYIPFLTCKGNYEPEYLVDKIKNSKLDEYGNGVYEIDGEYVYRGDDVNNYITFNNQTWRIVSIDSEGDVKIVFNDKDNERYAWDTAYNSEKNKEYGVTTDYLRTDIRKMLNDYYENVLTVKVKANLVSKTLCVGGLKVGDTSTKEIECSITKVDEYVGLLTVRDYQLASLDQGCTGYNKQECTNYNYISDDISSWLLTKNSENSYEVYFLNKTITPQKASTSRKVSPVVFLSKDTIILEGKGTQDEPYVIK